MKKVIAAAAAVLAFVLLCGCQYAEDRVSEQILAQLTDNADYAEYEQLQETGQLDEDGRYIPEIVRERGEPDGQIHVTFAQNNFLECSYYLDEALTEPADTAYCYLDPGECIYAAEPVSTNEISSQYAFVGFKVYEYDENGNRLGELALDESDPLVLQIPADYTGTELSVEPYGVYNPQALSLSAVWYDEDGDPEDVGGTWYVNGEVFSEGESELDAFTEYSVTYKYDADKYYLYASSVETADDTDGEITFVTDSKNDGSYVLTMRPYTDTTVDGGKNLVSASVNGQSIEVGKNNLNLGKLKAGDKIVLVCENDYKITCDADISFELEEKTSGREYTFVVPERGLQKLTFSAVKRNVVIKIDQNGVLSRGWNTVTNTVTGWFKSDGEDETILTISNGTDSYTYEELRNKEYIAPGDADTLTITLNDTSDDVIVTVTVNGGETEVLTGTMTLTYDEVNKLEIHVEVPESEGE